MIERQIIENQMRGLRHMLRHLDSGLADDDVQQMHMQIIEALDVIEAAVLPLIFETLDMIDPYRTDLSQEINPRPPQRRKLLDHKPIRPPDWRPPRIHPARGEL